MNTTATTTAAPLLEFDALTLASSHAGPALYDANLTLHAGELALVRLEAANPDVPLVDAALGLRSPLRGHVRCATRDWETLSPDDACALRGTCGVLLARRNYVARYALDANILLAQFHHTRRPHAELIDEAQQLATAFGLPGLPRMNASGALPADVRRAGCVRAFFGRPRVIFLERPLDGIYPDLFTELLQAVRSAQARNAAILWTTAETGVWNEPALHSATRYRMTGAQLILVGGNA